MRLTPGSPEPHGVTPDAEGVNVAVVSGAADSIDFCLFGADGAEQRFRLPARTGEVFHGHVAGVRVGDRYGLRAHGPYAPERGLLFDPGKLLVDPQAVALDRPFDLAPVLFSGPEAALDSAAVVPKAIVTAAPGPAPPLFTVPWAETVIYEAHVRGLTQCRADIPEPVRGTVAALAHPGVIAHLRDLGVTTLELLPLAAWIDERHLPPLGLSNYWGYNPVAFCAPDPRLAPGGWAEISAATAALNAAGIEVIVDVVFNHSGEGDALGPTLSLRGLDNPGYYRLAPEAAGQYVNDAGTGNILRCDAPQVVRLVMDALRTWRRRGGVSGFRFDLATVLGRRAEGFDPAAPLLSAMLQDPELRDLKLIVEPWDCGPGGHQLGRFPAAFAEWNDRYRDGVRRFWGRHGATRGELAARAAGSRSEFAGKARPSRSINFITAHDGFTLADLVSYAGKHNSANGEANRDGTDANWSWNHGHEGASAEADVIARREADQRALLATLFCARGTPMIAMGSEFAHSQGGNNNAYAQDNPASWLDWSGARGLDGFIARLAAARRAHPALHSDRFLSGEALAGGAADVVWGDQTGGLLSAGAWDDPGGEVLQAALAAPDAAGGLDRVLVIFNRGDDTAAVSPVAPRSGAAWRVVLDSHDPGRGPSLATGAVAVAARSVLLLEEAPLQADRRRSGTDDGLVAAVAAAAGIEPSWWDLAGQPHHVTPETQTALLASMGLSVHSADAARDSLRALAAQAARPLPDVQVVTAGHAASIVTAGAAHWLTITDEGGAARRLRVADGVAALPPLEPGRYRMEVDGAAGRLIVAPGQAYEPPDMAAGARRFGVSAQLYGLRRSPDRALGDFDSLAQLARAARTQGAAFLAVNPLHMLFPGDRSRVSPYHPSDRRYLDPLYIATAAAPARGPADAGGLLDYVGGWAETSAALDATLGQADIDAADLQAFRERAGAGLHRFAIFQALAEAHPGEPWTGWPAPLRDADSAAVRAFALQHAERVAFHERLQVLADRQLGAAAAAAPGLGLIRDLAVGAAPDGAEVWAARGDWALGASIGAPPDDFAPQGQVWALPPPNPRAWRSQAYEPFAALLRANMRHASALRIDHVLGLQRLFWVPDGAPGAAGAYVAAPRDDLLGVLCLESERARCLVIGEDLGTVPEGLREALAERRVYGYSVLPFERDGEALRAPGAYRSKALACAATHDLPPLAGWWSGEDLRERAAIGLLPEAALASAVAERREAKGELLAALRAAGLTVRSDAEAPFDDALAAAIHAFVAGSNAQLVLVQLEDLAGAERSQNVPGTDRERPNWRLGLPPLDDVLASARAEFILSAVRQTRS